MKDSAYNLAIRGEEERYFLFNTRSGAACSMNASEYRTYMASAGGTSPLEAAAGTLARLADGGFLVDNDTDELARIESGHVAARTSRERLSLVIAPSMACNLGCPYCFEVNRYPGRMSDGMQDNTARLVRRYFESGTKHLAVIWYGGEPLLALPVIGNLSEAFLDLCEEFGCAYSAEIVTNGTLLNDARARRLAAWKIARAQITLDGVPEVHDKLRVPKDGSPTFHRILEGIETAAAHMHVCVRINVSREGAARLEELLQILAARGLNTRVTAYIAPLRGLPNLGPDLDPGLAGRRGTPDEFLDIHEMAELALRFHDLLWKYGFPAHPDILPRPRTTACMADHDHSWLIEANGDVQKCYWTAGHKDEAAGHLSASGIACHAPHKKWDGWSAFTRADCARCVMLPLCLGRCPLRQLGGEADCCPVFLHNWPRVMAHAAGFAAEKAVPVHLSLAGSRIKDVAAGDIAGLPSGSRIC